MNSLLLFLVKSTLSLSLLYLAFSVLIRKETFFKLNRMVLLVMVFSSMLIPFLYVPKPVQPRIPVNLEPIFQISPMIEEPVSTTEIPITIQSAVPASETMQPVTIPVQTIVIFVYLSGVLTSFLMFVYSIGSVLLLFRKAQKTELNGIRVLIVDQDIPAFSFGRNILISQHDFDTNYDAIITHEQSHIRLGHFYDLMLMELVKIVFWFNPLVYRMVNDLKEIHEFQADDHTLHSGIDATQYQILIIQKCVGHQKFALANSFNHCQIKNRITMMNKQKTSKARRWKVATFLPLLALLLMFCGRRGGNEPPSNSFQLMDQTEKLDQCFLLFDSMTEPFKFEMNLVGGSVDENYNFADTSQVKQLIWLSFKPKEICSLTDGEYKFSSISPLSSPWMSFSGKIRQGNKEMKIKGGVVNCKQDSGKIKVTFKLNGENDSELIGSYNGNYSRLTRIKKSFIQPGINPDTTVILNSDSPGIKIVFKKDGNYINNKKYSHKDFVAKVKEWMKTKPEQRKKLSFSTDPGVELSDKRNREISAISNETHMLFASDVGVDKQAVFPGGEDEMFRWIDKNKIYPKNPETYLSGKMVGVKFKVDENGKVGKAIIVDGVNPELDAEVLRVISQMPKWKPALRKGVPVSVERRIGVSFRPI